MATAKKQDAAKQLRVNEKKWSKELMSTGWTAIPNIIVEHQKDLGLTPLDITILLHLSTYWWTAETMPHPSKTTIATAIGCTPRAVQRRIALMEGRGLIQRIERREKGAGTEGSKPNLYDFAGLIKAAKPFAAEKAKRIATKVAVKQAKAGTKAGNVVKFTPKKDA